MILKSVPSVSSFCGCCDLKVGNTVVASLRLIYDIIVITLCVAVLFSLVGVEEKTEELGINDTSLKLRELLVTFVILVVIAIAVVSLLFSYWFIKSISSNNPSKMKYYVILNGVQVILSCIYAIVSLNLLYFIVTGLEIYLFICAHSLYKLYMSAFQEDTTNEPKTPMTGNPNIQSTSYGSGAFHEDKVNEPKIAVNVHDQPPSYGSGEYEGGKYP